MSLLLGAAVLAAVTVAISLLAQRDRRISEDTAMGVAFAGLFPLGVILLALQSNPTRSLGDFLFGDVLANSPTDVLTTVVVSALILAGLVGLHRAALACSFDRPYAASLGYRPGVVDAVLLCLVAATVVVAILAVGNVLALALLIAPAATARLLLGRLVPMMLLAGALGTLSGVVALELSYWVGRRGELDHRPVLGRPVPRRVRREGALRPACRGPPPRRARVSPRARPRGGGAGSGPPTRSAGRGPRCLP